MSTATKIVLGTIATAVLFTLAIVVNHALA